MNIGIVSPSFGQGGANMVASIVGKELSKTNTVYFLPFLEDDNFLSLDQKKMIPINANRSIFEKMWIKSRKTIEFLFNDKSFTPSKYTKKELKSLISIIKEKEIDILILNSYISVAFFSTSIKKIFPNIKIISWMHEDTDYCFNDITKNYHLAFIAAIKSSDSIVCLSQKAYEVYKQINPNSFIIYNPMVLNSDRKANLKENVISFTSRLDIKIKGLDFLVDVAKGISDGWTIRVAGQGTPEEEEEFFRLINKNGVSTKIEYVGPLSGDELKAHYLSSSIFLSTSRTEALPLVIIEALSYGLPVVSFDHSGAIELLNQGENGILVSDFDTDEMADKVNSLIENFDLRESYQKKALKKAKSFEMSNILEKWNIVLNS